MTTIRVPATSANLGPGFDSCGLSLSLYLYLEVHETTSEWVIEHDLPGIPKNQENLVVTTALALAPDLSPRKLKMYTDIPAARGLGSSSTAIVAGIELANYLGKLELTMDQKVVLATQLEGHPDNVAPAICGDFVVACYEESDVNYVKHHFPSCDIVAFIPETELLTSESRGVLPSELAYKEAVTASGISNVMIAAIINNNLELAGKMMEKDLWHEKYRAPLVPHLAQIKEIGHAIGTYGCVLSGAGPTVLVFSPKDKTAELVEKLTELSRTAAIKVLAVDQEGTKVY